MSALAIALPLQFGTAGHGYAATDPSEKAAEPGFEQPPVSLNDLRSITTTFKSHASVDEKTLSDAEDQWNKAYWNLFIWRHPVNKNVEFAIDDDNGQLALKPWGTPDYIQELVESAKQLIGNPGRNEQKRADGLQLPVEA